MICRSCLGNDLAVVFDLGNHRISDFRDDDELPPKYPLTLLYCKDCYLVQLSRTVPRDLMYHDRYGFKSGVNDTIREDLGVVVAEALKWVTPKYWLDIACNDGTLLSQVPLPQRQKYGCDPVSKYANEAKQHGTVVDAFFHPGYFDGRRFDVISSISMIYDVDDLNSFVNGVRSLLAKDGVWVVQQNYLAESMRIGALDNICHEHITYFTLTSLEQLLHRHDLEVLDVSESTVNGGNFRTIIGHRGERTPKISVAEMRQRELRQQLATSVPYAEFGRRGLQATREMASLVRHLNRSGKTVYLCGASTRVQTLLQAAGLGVDDLPFAVDRNPEKVSKKISSVGIPIISEEQARKDHPDYMLVSPWFFRDEFVEREAEYLDRGGALIFPLPVLDIVSRKPTLVAA